MITAGLIHWILNTLNITVHIRDVCVFLAPTFSGLTSISTFLLTRELWNQGAGLLAACFIAIVPGYISRSVAGSFDNEGIAIFALQFTYYLWGHSGVVLCFPAHRSPGPFGSSGHSLTISLVAAALPSGALVHVARPELYRVSAWGGYVFIINLIPLHVFVLLLMQRYSKRVYIGVFALLQAYAFLQYLRDRLTKQEFQTLFFLGVSLAAGAVFLSVIYLTYTGMQKYTFQLLHQCLNISLRHGCLSSLIYIFLCVPSQQAYGSASKISTMKEYLAGKVRKHVTEQEKPEEGLGPNIKSIVTMLMLMLLMMFAVHCTWVTSNAYSSPSVVLASYNHDGTRNILDDFREAYFWLRQNTDEHARVMSWWDYGYQIAGMANRTTLVDNNTWNNSHIALVGKAMSSNETAAYKIMRSLDVDYVLVIFGGVIGYSGDDINKFLWMVRIAEGEHPKDIREGDYFTQQGEFRVDRAGSPTLLNCLMYKMSYYRFGEMQLDFRTPPGFDRTRNAEIGNKDIKFKHLEEAFTSEHWLVRIYKVKAPDNRETLGHKPRVTNIFPKQKYLSKKDLAASTEERGPHTQGLTVLSEEEQKKGWRLSVSGILGSEENVLPDCGQHHSTDHSNLHQEQGQMWTDNLGLGSEQVSAKGGHSPFCQDRAPFSDRDFNRLCPFSLHWDMSWQNCGNVRKNTESREQKGAQDYPGQPRRV
uniref:Dolichyl-diphosphooligosaccharide--protein glycosyltransferase subunit STT3B n=1 Tax=Rattus norvegicus TaxID=10116 RepID=Q7TQ74_RAT|nr:Ac1573 [Rattus norvegicus]